MQIMEASIRISDADLIFIEKIIKKVIHEVLDTHSTKESFPKYMNKRQAASYLNCSPKTLDKYISKGLEVMVIDNTHRIDKDDCDKFVELNKK
ncbi:hypothetical protein QJ527_12270 [Enterococcus mundtii]|uniref:hypothetical protein n=1 Tax=Enterococcus TaxID=1350 RepID=UPI00254355BD|nr:hypothetical protein [Enterococcus mundtii]MDK4212308.1 hypothetical protein [Enterococcus mundtii]